MPPSSQPQVANDETKQKFAKILQNNGIFDEVDTVRIHEPEELKGEHMAAATVYVHIEFKDPSKKPKNLFVKKFHDNETHKMMVKQMRIMEKESTFFNDFLPEVRKFCKQHNDCENLLDFFPKCLFGDDETIVLENVVVDDTFIMLPKEDHQDMYTTKYVLSNLAKFHASSFALIEDVGRETFRENHEVLILESFLSDNPYMNMSSMFDNGIGTCINIIKSSGIDGGDEAIATLAGYIGKVIDAFKDILTYNPEEKLLVINHGDCWNNNMLFKKDPATGKVNDHMFVDLQMTRLSSPNVDIGYFFFTSVKPDIRRSHLKELLQHYFDTFQKTLESFDMKCPITFEEFIENYKQKCWLGYWTYTCLMSVIGAMKDLDMSTMGSDPEEMMDIFKNHINNWVASNPEKSFKIAYELVASTKEFVELTSK